MKAPGRLDVIRRFREAGGKIAAVLPVHYPRAIFRAFGILPVEVWGPPGADFSLSSSHLQTYVCPMAHGALSLLKSEAGGLVDLVVVPHTCDTFQGLGSLLRDVAGIPQRVITFYLPKGNRKTDVRFLSEELRGLYQELSQFTGLKPSPDSLMEHQLREEEANSLLRSLYRSRAKLGLGDLEFYRLVRLREYLPVEEFIHLLKKTLESLPVSGDKGGVSIVVSGIVPEPMEIFDVIGEFGGRVVADDLACCHRRIYRFEGEGDDPFVRMARYLISGPPDVLKGSSLKDRAEELIGLCGRHGAKGVVFYLPKFCEPELFDIPILREFLEKEGVRSLVVEVDPTKPLSQQVVNRIGAFLEVL